MTTGTPTVGADAAYRSAVRAVVDLGLPAGAYRELLVHSFSVTDLRRRAPRVRQKEFDLAKAGHRVVRKLAKGGDASWAVLTGDVPGAFDAPGLLRQMEGAVDRLRRNPTTRQASVVAYRPQDSISPPGIDIPCVLGWFFNLRNGVVHTSVAMRSNNAYTYVPYNIFESSVLAEIVATELGAQLGGMQYVALSLHVRESDLGSAVDMLNSTAPVDEMVLPPMPRTAPLDEARQLVEAAVAANAQLSSRHPTTREAGRALARADRLDEYWRIVFLLHVAFELTSRGADAGVAIDLLPETIAERVRSRSAAR